MSLENVEVVRRFLDHWNETGEPLWAEVDPDAVFAIDPGSFLAGTYRGHDEMRTLVRLTRETFDQFCYEFDELVDVGESILGLGRIHARGAERRDGHPVGRRGVSAA